MWIKPDAGYRLDQSRERATGGHGLELAVTAKTVLRHGGDFTTDDWLLGGAKMHIRLPGLDANYL